MKAPILPHAIPSLEGLYLLMPFGISSASKIWQRSMEEEFEDTEGVEIIVDDLAV